MMTASRKGATVRLESAAAASVLGIPGVFVSVLTLGAVGMSRTGDGLGGSSAAVVVIPALICSAATGGVVWLLLRMWHSDTWGGLRSATQPGYPFCFLVSCGQHAVSLLAVTAPEELGWRLTLEAPWTYVYLAGTGFLGAIFCAQVMGLHGYQDGPGV